MIAVYSGNA